MKIIPFRRSYMPPRVFNVTYYLIGANVVFFLVGILSPVFFGILALSGSGMAHGFIWQLASFGFVEQLGNLWNLVFYLLALYFFGLQVEQTVGSIEFILLYVALSIATAVFALILFRVLGSDFMLYGATGLVSAIMLVWASFNPWQPIYLFGIVPVRAPVLMAIVVVVMVLGVLISGPVALLHLITVVLAWVYMLLRHKRNMFSTLFNR